VQYRKYSLHPSITNGSQQRIAHEETTSTANRIHPPTDISCLMNGIPSCPQNGHRTDPSGIAGGIGEGGGKDIACCYTRSHHLQSLKLRSETADIHLRIRTSED
jgi:hypothetical protein